MDEVMENIPSGEREIGADFNGNVGEGNQGDEGVMGRFGGQCGAGSASAIGFEPILVCSGDGQNDRGHQTQ